MVKTTIAIEPETIARLKKQWQHGDDTYDSVINRILDTVSPLGTEESGSKRGVGSKNK